MPIRNKEIPEKFLCPKCMEIKQISEFYKNKSRWCGVDCWCKCCQLIAQTKRNIKNKSKNREKRISNPINNMLTGAKRRAMIKGIPFNITINDIFVPSHCPVFGIKLEVAKGSSKNNSPTLDRIDPKVGYVVGNIAVISAVANRRKNDSTIEELKHILRYIESKTMGEELCQ